MINRNQWLLWASLLFSLTLGLLWSFFPLADAKERLDKFPLQGPGFEGRTIPLEPWELDFFTNVNILKRVYESQGQRFFMTALDGTKNRHPVHDPFYCFTGSGWALVSRESIPVTGGYIDLIKMKKGLERKEALVWFSNGDTRHSSAFTYYLQTTLRRISLGLSGGEPLLIVIQPMDRFPLNWEKLLKDFPELLTL